MMTTFKKDHPPVCNNPERNPQHDSFQESEVCKTAQSMKDEVFRKNLPFAQIRSIAVVGAGNLDVLAAPVSEKVFEKGTLPVDSIRMSLGGDALNECSVLGALKTDVTWVSLQTQDFAGSLIRDFCASWNIKIQKIDADAPTGINIVLVQPDGERCFITCPATNMRKLKKDDIPFIHADIVCLASLFVSYDLSLADAALLMQQWKAEGKITCMDTTTAKHGESIEDMKQILPHVDYYFTNQKEAESITHTKDPLESLSLLEKAGAHTILLKQGSKSVLVYHDGQITASTVTPNPACIDTTGCGDSFAAGFLYGLGHGFDFWQCLEMAKNCGALACEQVGATEAFRKLSYQQLMERLISQIPAPLQP